MMVICMQHVDGNAEFDPEIDLLVGEMTEGDNGAYSMSDLRYNGYFLHEKVAPEGFLRDDGYYYFTAPVEPDQYTDYLLEGVKLKENAVLPKLAEEGNLQVDVLVDAVQAHGTAAVNQAWDYPTSEGLQIY